MKPEEVIEFVKEAKSVAPKTQAAIDDLTRKFQAIQERQIDNAKETAPTGESLRKFVGQDGKVLLKSATATETFAGKSVEVERAGLLDGTPCNEWHADFQRLNTARYFAQRILKGGKTPNLDRELLSMAAKAPREIRSQLEATIKAISDTSGSGAEWIPDTWSQNLYEEYYAPAGIDAMFGMVDVAGPLVVPKISDTIRPYILGQISSDDPAKFTASTPGSSNQTIEVGGLAARVIVDQSATEDSIFPILPEIQRRLARALRDGYEDAMINGSLTATHEDAIQNWNIRSRWGATGLGGAADHRRQFDGLRRIAIARSASSDMSASQTITGVMSSLLGALGERGATDAVILVSPEVFFKKFLTDSNVLTVDKLGPNATLLNGQLAAVAGVPIVMTRWLSADMNASGLFDNVTTTKSGVLAVSRAEFSHYQRRAAAVEIDKDITMGAFNLVATLRRTFKTLSGSGSKVAAYGYNWL
jgi:HK97 family phage major capsid protein